MSNLFTDILNRKTSISVVGLGYVGMPIAVAFAKKVNVVGYDINAKKIEQYKAGKDPTNEVGDEAIKNSKTFFTSDETKLREALFHIVAVPTPINSDKTPDLTPVIDASKTVGRNLCEGSIVVYESTVYPGVTEDICAPILEDLSGLKCGRDFFIGYSPERINPGDKVNRLETIVKIVSGMNNDTLETIAKVYELVVAAGVHRASSIKVAEAAKVVENSQRDINIAFMNELAMTFDKMGINTNEVIQAMNTKWNALKFYPGLVGGHCIGVDPYYFIYEAEKLGYHSQIILSGRKINDGMGAFVADAAIKQMILVGKAPKKCKVAILGLTFKENCPDIRNSKVADVIRRLNEYGIQPHVCDPWAANNEVKMEYGVVLKPIEEINDVDCVIIAVAHEQFRNMSLSRIDKLFGMKPNQEKVLVDIKSILNKNDVVDAGYTYWNL